MKRFRSRAVTALIVVGLVAISGVALAAEDDTVFNYGYDQDSQFFMWNVTSLERDGLEDEESTTDAELDGGHVAGPRGQVNHGMFLKQFNELYEGENRGCLVRHIARSDLGKDDQHVQADPDFEAADPVEPTEDGTITFTTTGADCVHGPEGDDGDEELDEESELRGPPQFVKDKFGGDHPGNGKGKPEGTPGRGRP